MVVAVSEPSLKSTEYEVVPGPPAPPTRIVPNLLSGSRPVIVLSENNNERMHQPMAAHLAMLRDDRLRAVPATSARGSGWV